jgi:hypothetical protein
MANWRIDWEILRSAQDDIVWSDQVLGRKAGVIVNKKTFAPVSQGKGLIYRVKISYKFTAIRFSLRD